MEMNHLIGVASCQLPVASKSQGFSGNWQLATTSEATPKDFLRLRLVQPRGGVGVHELGAEPGANLEVGGGADDDAVAGREPRDDLDALDAADAEADGVDADEPLVADDEHPAGLHGLAGDDHRLLLRL